MPYYSFVVVVVAAANADAAAAKFKFKILVIFIHCYGFSFLGTHCIILPMHMAVNKAQPTHTKYCTWAEYKLHKL